MLEAIIDMAMKQQDNLLKEERNKKRCQDDLF